MVIVIVICTGVAGVCIAALSLNSYLGRRMAHEMRNYEASTSLRIQGTKEALEGSLRRLSEAERFEAPQAGDPAVRNANAAGLFTDPQATSPRTRCVQVALWVDR